jgi:hypothetical protein
MHGLVVFCADVGSVRAGNFGWARTEPRDAVAEYDSSSPVHLVAAVVDELQAGRPVALGFECPLFVPVPASAAALGAGRGGEGNRPWSAGAGVGTLATGLVQAAWVVTAIRTRCPDDALHLEWPAFAAASRGLLLWEAFVSATAKGKTHVDDAAIAVAAFSGLLPDHVAGSPITAERPLSLAGAVALWSGWLQDPQVLHQVRS